MTPQQCIRAAALLEQQAQSLVGSFTYAGRWIGEEGKAAAREHRQCRRLAGALRKMVARYFAKASG